VVTAVTWQTSQENTWQREWGPNVGTAALTILVTVLVVERIMTREKRQAADRRRRWIMGEGESGYPYGAYGAWQTHVRAIASDYWYSHWKTYRQLPDRVLPLLDHWLQGQASEDVPLRTANTRLDEINRLTRLEEAGDVAPEERVMLGRPTRSELLLASAKGLFGAVQPLRESGADVVGHEVILAIDAFGKELDWIQSSFHVGRPLAPGGRGYQRNPEEEERGALEMIVLTTRGLGRVLERLDGRFGHPTPSMPPRRDGEQLIGEPGQP